VNGPPSSYTRHPAVLWRIVGDEVLLARRGSGDLDQLRDSATDAWQLLSEPQTLGSLVEALADRYGQRPDAIRADVMALLDEMLVRDWVVRVDADE
jgi:Coenzyme PQQ synthesis protein D (PqqD)